MQQTGHYSLALLVSAFVGLIGLVAWLVVLPPVQPIDWSAHSRCTRTDKMLKETFP